MCIRDRGYDISVDDFIDSCMVRGELPEDTETGRVGPDPDQVFLGDPYTSQAVSYTHLDVYKRQTYRVVTSFAAGNEATTSYSSSVTA